MGDFTHAVAGLGADLAEHPLTKGVISSNQALRGFKAAMDAALGRSSQPLTELGALWRPWMATAAVEGTGEMAVLAAFAALQRRGSGPGRRR